MSKASIHVQKLHLLKFHFSLCSFKYKCWSFVANSRGWYPQCHVMLCIVWASVGSVNRSSEKHDDHQQRHSVTGEPSPKKRWTTCIPFHFELVLCMICCKHMCVCDYVWMCQMVLYVYLWSYTHTNTSIYANCTIWCLFVKVRGGFFKFIYILELFGILIHWNT